MKTKEKSNKSVSIADILMVLGFLALGASTFLGAQLLKDDFTMSAIICAAVLVGTALLLWVLCIAKQQKNYRSTWFVVEMLVLVVFIGGFVYATGYGRHFQYITSIKNELVDAAQNDANTIKGLFAEYESREKSDIADIQNSVNHIPNNVKIEAKDYATQEKLDNWVGNSDEVLKSRQSYSTYALNRIASSFATLLEDDILLGTKYHSLKLKSEARLDSLVYTMKNGANYYDYYSIAKTFKKDNKDVAENLTGLSNHPMKFEINASRVNDRTYISAYEKGNTYESDDKTMQLIKYFDGKMKATITGWALTALLLFLVLCAYFAAPRSRRVTALSRGKFSSADGGIDICKNI